MVRRPGHVASGRCGRATPLHAARPAHVRWGWRVPCDAWYEGPGPASRGRWWCADAPAWLCSSCALLARPAPVEPPHGPTSAPDTSTVLTCGLHARLALINGQREGDAAHSPSATPPIRPGEGGDTAQTAALMSLCRYRRADSASLTWLLCRATVGRAALTRREGRTVDRGRAAGRHHAARAAWAPPSLCQGQRARDASGDAGGTGPLRLSHPWAPSDSRR